MLGLEEKKELGRRLIEEFVNGGREAVADQLFSPTLQDHGSSFGTVVGPEGIKQLVRMFRRAFPDVHFEIEHLIAEGDKLVIHMTGTGTHKEEFMGRLATGRKVAFRSMTVLRIGENKVVERWNVIDINGIIHQIEADQ